MQKNTGEQGRRGSQENRNAQRGGAAHVSPADRQKSATVQSSRRSGWVISGNSWETASDGAESHRRFYRGKDLTSAFDDGTFSASVADGSFRGIFPGDYIIRNVTVPAPAGNFWSRLFPPPQTVRKLAIFRVLVRQSTHFLPYEKSGISAGFLDQFDCKKERQTDPSFSSRGRIFR